RARRARVARAVARAPRGGRWLAVRPGTLRLPQARRGADQRAADPRRWRAAFRLLGASPGGGHHPSEAGGSADRRDRRRWGHERGGLPARAPAARGLGLAQFGFARGRNAAAGLPPARAPRARTPGLTPSPG